MFRGPRAADAKDGAVHRRGLAELNAAETKRDEKAREVARLLGLAARKMCDTIVNAQKPPAPGLGAHDPQERGKGPNRAFFGETFFF
jgi:hypothetical protein